MSPVGPAFMRAALATRALSSSIVSTVPSSLVIANQPNKTLFASWAEEPSVLYFPEADLTATIPITVFRSGAVEAECSAVKSQVTLFEAIDDVFDRSFLEYVYLQGPTEYEDGLADCLSQAYRTKLVLSCNASPETVAVSAPQDIESGPYVASINSGKAHLGRLYRAYHDVYQSFMSGAIPGQDDSFLPVPINTVSDNTQAIAVPSRVYALNASSSEPFKGLRIGVKDIIDLKGSKTSMGNRAWFDLYDASTENAPAMQKLIDFGASIVGKTKTAQFANADRPTQDWVDYHHAFNPRGDGYQDAGGSSAGSGSAMAAYDWIDVCIGSDTGGSVYIPAAKQGIYGIRPTFDSLPLGGVLPEGPYFDALGYYSRDPYQLESFGKTWMGSAHRSYSAFPKKIFMPSDLFPVVNNTRANAVYEDFFTKLTSFLDASVDTRNVSELWSQNPDLPGRNESFFPYMHEVSFNLEWKYQWDTVIGPFFDDYAAKNDGRTPFLNPTVAARINFYKNQSLEYFDDARTRRDNYIRFWEDEVLQADEESCSSALWAIPSNAGTPAYINNALPAPIVNTSALTFAMWYYSSVSGSPEVVLPIGQIPYNSTISGIEEYLPVTVDLIARPGCDYMLLDLTAKLADAGILLKVKTGRAAF